MQVHDDEQRSVTNRARREQIVQATMELIAEQGCRAATLQAVAKRAGIRSTRTISYHFAGKDDLIAAVSAEIFRIIGAFVAGQATAPDDPRDALAAYIRSAVALNQTHRIPMRALTSIVLDHRPETEERPYDTKQENTAVTRVQDILERGQQAGVFRPFDAWVMAVTVQRSLDGIGFLLEARPDLDLTHYADQLVDTFDRATRAPRARRKGAKS
ncbi:TetR/AcrR family transcriptional regulator [Amycolatopsis sp. NPDC088138]|uniref:TetR/AcrR family transcriptional regulator n=1 Tax=Amycolatopsis sp. NPDC088138 TaxID=3363938 RepID=UPI0038227245